MPIQQPRDARYQVAFDRLVSLEFGMSPSQARAELEQWDQEAARRGLDRRSPDYYGEFFRWRFPPPKQ